jgi:serine protease Do
VATRCWDVFGLKLEKASAAQLEPFRNRYRGGMRVMKVRSKSPAADYGIVEGDILVGLHVWETVRQEDINYILNQSNLISGNDPLKFYVIRRQEGRPEVLYGNLRFASRQK